MIPIPTFYNGYSFRSRLEARWAVFFDAMGLRHEYEAEGFDFDGERYLPDFWIPDTRIFVEIKPSSVHGDLDPQCIRQRILASLAHAKGVTLWTVYGNPYADEHKIELPDAEDSDRWYAFAECRRCGGLAVSALDGESGNDAPHSCSTPRDRAPILQGTRLIRAFTKARSAKFERLESTIPAFRR